MNCATKPAPVAARSVKETIEHLLLEENGRELQVQIRECFAQVARGADGLNLGQLQAFVQLLSQRLGVPPSIFLADISANFLRYDLYRTSTLTQRECMRFTVSHLYTHWWSKLGASLERTPEAPAYASLEAAGYRVIAKLGEGGQGTVYLASDPDGEEVCLKCIKKDKLDKQGLEDLKREFCSMKILANPALASMSAIFYDSESFYAVSEPYIGGDFTTLKQRAIEQRVSMSEDWWRSVVVQSLRAVAHLHERAVMHCDLKEPNFMLKTPDYAEPYVVLIDFGFARMFTAEPTGLVQGTFGYIPPETFRAGRWFPRGDVFSWGVTILQMLVDKVVPPLPIPGRPPVGIFLEGVQQSFQAIAQATCTRQPPFHLVPAPLYGLGVLLARCLEKQLPQRIKAHEALQDSWCTAGARLPPVAVYSGSTITRMAEELNPGLQETVQALQALLVDADDEEHVGRSNTTSSDVGLVKTKTSVTEQLGQDPSLRERLVRSAMRWFGSAQPGEGRSLRSDSRRVRTRMLRALRVGNG